MIPCSWLRIVGGWGAWCLLCVSACWGHRPETQYVLKDYHAALRAAQEELSNPDGLGQARSADAHMVALLSLAKLGGMAMSISQSDAEVLAHQQALNKFLPADSARRAKLAWAVGSYYLATYRLQSARKSLQDALDLATYRHDLEMQLRALQGLSEVDLSMGQIASSDRSLQNAIAIGKAAATANRCRTDPGVLDAYLSLLDYEMHYAASVRERSGGPALTRPAETDTAFARQRFDNAWQDMDQLLAQSDGGDLVPLRVMQEERVIRRAVLQLRAAVLFAKRSRRVFNDEKGAQSRAQTDEKWAQALYERVQADLDQAGDIARKPLQNRIACAQAQMMAAWGNARAAELADQCIEGAGADRDRLFVQEELSILADIYERAGSLQKAAELYQEDASRYERLRGGLGVKDRESFFRGPARIPWAGLLRVRVRQYHENKSAANLDRLLAVIDGMRARLLYELASGKTADQVGLKALRGRLADGSALLVVANAEREHELLLVTRQIVRAITVPVSEGDVNKTWMKARQDVTQPDETVAARSSAVRQLSGWFLAPIAAEMANIHRVTVVADGVLGAFPFELLTLDNHRLVDATTVVGTPSLAFFVRETPPRPEPVGAYIVVPAPRRLLTSCSCSRNWELISSADAGADRDERTDADAIAEFFSVTRRQIIAGQKATESTMERLPVGGYSYLHIQTHGHGGETDDTEPAVELTPDAASDGRWTASEVMKRRFENTLTVLAACSTGTGQVFEGEGVIGLGRAFLAAGSRGVIISLWPVDSGATTQLMWSLYRYLLAGIDPGRALAMAKRRVAENKQWRAPDFWAGFQLLAEGGLLVDRGGDMPPAGAFTEDRSIQEPF